jgi:outer membrane protein TolC
MPELNGLINRFSQRIIIFVLVVSPCISFAQLSIDSANAIARNNYPLIKQKDLIRQTADLSIENLRKGYLPQVTLSGQATYQTDVTKVDIPFPGIKITPPSKDQYKIVADVNQVLYDGGVIKQQKALQELTASSEDQRIEVELYKLKEKINQLYLGVLYLDEQIKQVDLIKKDIQSGIKKTDAQVQNGTAFKSNLNTLKAELLKTDQRLIELKAGRKGLLGTLGLFLNKSLDENIILEKPRVSAVSQTEITRPEIKLFNEQSRVAEHQYKLIHARNLPRTSLFVQGGYGRPGLNLLKNEFAPFAIGGIRLNWSLAGLYTSKKEKQLVEISRKGIDIQKETFVLNTNTQAQQQSAEIEKLQQLVATDFEIIELRKSVKDAANAQLENGVITANDYLREVNAEDLARQMLITHQLQLLQAQINYQTILGK